MDWLVSIFFLCIFAVFIICTILLIHLMSRTIEFLDILIDKENKELHDKETQKIKQRIFR